MRTGLAVLGIVIGIGSVIALLSLGAGTQEAVQAQIESLGSNLLTIMPGAVRQGGVMGAMGGRTTLTLDDAKAIAVSSEITTVKNVSPELERRAQVTTGSNNTNTEIIGATPIYADVHKVNVAAGNFITQRDTDNMTKVAVLGPNVVTDLFGETANPVGQTLRITGKTFNIIGVTTAKGGAGFMSQDDRI
jgi:putative ABC transport system permease protein